MNFTKQDTIDYLNKIVEDEATRLDVNKTLIEIYEGNVLENLMDKLKSDLGENSSEQSRSRAVPVNILKQVTNKLSTIYQNTPRRFVDPENQSDVQLVEYFEDQLKLNHNLNYNNELQNIFGYTYQQIVTNNGKPQTRAIPNHRFLPVNTNPVDPSELNILIMLMGKGIDKDGKEEVEIRWAWSDEQFVIFDSNGSIRTDMMAERAEVEEGAPLTDLFVNPMGKIPGVYLTTSRNSIMPVVPHDILQLSLLLPILLTDLNFAAKFSVFSILYGIDVDDENLKMSPAVFWRFKSKHGGEKPQIGSIKPDVDIDKVLNLAATELALWLQSIGIRPGAVGSLNGDNFESGIAKVIDEADIQDHQSKQQMIYRYFEIEYWDLLLKTMHPYWLTSIELDESVPTNIFSVNAMVDVIFTKKVPVHSRGALAKDYMVEIEGRLISRREVMRRLNPEFGEDKIDEILAEISEEQAMLSPVVGANPFGNDDGQGDNVDEGEENDG